MGLNCLLIECAGKKIIVDTGVGPKDNYRDKEMYGLVPSRLMRSLKGLGLGPRDIDAVVLSHLHFSHAGGSTRMDRLGDMVPSFPRATYYVQRSSWEDAHNPSLRNTEAFRVEDFAPIADRGQLELLDGDTELFPGLTLVVTDGHCLGHQIAVFAYGGERVVYLGDLVPTPHHLGLTIISSFDYEPETTLDQKRAILAEAERQGHLLVFPHGHETRGRLPGAPAGHELPAPRGILGPHTGERPSRRPGGADRREGFSTATPCCTAYPPAGDLPISPPQRR